MVAGIALMAAAITDTIAHFIVAGFAGVAIYATAMTTAAAAAAGAAAPDRGDRDVDAAGHLVGADVRRRHRGAGDRLPDPTAGGGRRAHRRRAVRRPPWRSRPFTGPGAAGPPGPPTSRWLARRASASPSCRTRSGSSTTDRMAGGAQPEQVSLHGNLDVSGAPPDVMFSVIGAAIDAPCAWQRRYSVADLGSGDRRAEQRRGDRRRPALPQHADGAGRIGDRDSRRLRGTRADGGADRDSRREPTSACSSLEPGSTPR